MMKIGRIILHGGVFALLNLAAIIGGFMIYHFVRQAPQLAVQIPAALAFNGIGFAAWMMIGERYAKSIMPRGRGELVLAGVASLPLAAAIFMGLHYATQHYVSSFGNVVGLWIYQAVVNALLIAIRSVLNEYAGSNLKRA